MKQYKLSDKELLVVEVPEDASDFEINPKHGVIVAHTGMFANFLPFGNWQILGRAGELTEEQAKGLVEEEKAFRNKCKPCYKNYNIQSGSGFGFSVLNTAIESFKSWCKANKIKDNELLLIKSQS